MSHSLKGGSNKGQPFVKFESRSSKRGTAIVGQGATHGQTLLAKNGSLVIGALLDSPLNGGHPAPAFSTPFWHDDLPRRRVWLARELGAG